MTTTAELDLTPPRDTFSAHEQRWLYENFSRLKDIIDALGGGSGAPTTAQYVTASADAGLSDEYVLTNTASVTWDFTTPGQAKANASGSGGLSMPAVLILGLGS